MRLRKLSKLLDPAFLTVGVSFHNFGKKIEWVDAERPRDHEQFDQIDPALTAFILRYEALSLPEPCGQFLLRDIRPLGCASARCQTREDLMAAVTWYAIIRLSNGNQQRVTILADNQINARLMIAAQYGRASIISGPHRLGLMMAI